MTPIEYTGLKALDETEQASLHTIATKFATKLERFYPDATLRIIVKTIDKGGKKNIQLTGKIDNPKKVAESQDSAWSINDVANKVFAHLESEVEKLRIGKKISVRSRK